MPNLFMGVNLGDLEVGIKNLSLYKGRKINSPPFSLDLTEIDQVILVPLKKTEGQNLIEIS